MRWATWGGKRRPSHPQPTKTAATLGPVALFAAFSMLKRDVSERGRALIWSRKRRVVALAIVAIAYVCAAQPAVAQPFPSKPARLVVPFPAGGPLDAVGRLLAQQLSERWG